MKVALATRRVNESNQKGRTPEYSAWASMQDRCMNKNAHNYKNYGARGIRVCRRWQASFAYFLADMGRRPTNGHSIERIKNNKGYSPSNCRWATAREQAQNRRHVTLYDFDGERLSIAELARRFKMGHRLVWTRIVKQGWTIRTALTVPSGLYHHRRT